MSTKVYALYRYTGGDIFDLLAWLKQLRTEYIHHTLETLRTFAPHKPESKEIDHVWLLEQVLQQTKLGKRSPYNIDASVCIYLHARQLYVHFFTDQAFLCEHIEGADMLVDCHYQNQSDQPDTVSDDEWERRRKLIEDIGIVDQPPSRAGMMFVFADEHDAFSLVWRL